MRRASHAPADLHPVSAVLLCNRRCQLVKQGLRALLPAHVWPTDEPSVSRFPLQPHSELLKRDFRVLLPSVLASLC